MPVLYLKVQSIPQFRALGLSSKSISESFITLYKLFFNKSPLKRDSFSESVVLGDHAMELLHSASVKRAEEPEGFGMGPLPTCKRVIQRA